MTERIVCFAVKDEARPFERFVRWQPKVQTLLTGMGGKNAEKAIRRALVGVSPKLVLSCGFAGGLRPGLDTGTVIFESTENQPLTTALSDAGARPGRFHCAGRVAATAKEKRALHEATGADAVEMESRFICAVCREHNIPAATVRVILDSVDQDLPLDFNQLMTSGQQVSYARLVKAILAAPGRIPALLLFREQCRSAAQKLAEVLELTLAKC